MNNTPAGERIHIGIFGKRNAGKSTLFNAILGQEMAVVSEHAGTTTDPVKKAMELLPLGPVVLIDTPGLDDEGDLGALRVEKTNRMLATVDLALVVKRADRTLDAWELHLLKVLNERKLPFMVVENCFEETELLEKEQVLMSGAMGGDASSDEKILDVARHALNAKTGEGIQALKDKLPQMVKQTRERTLIGDLVKEGDTIIMVVPIDEAAPKGRIILPQQMVLREALDMHARTIVVQPEELSEVLKLVASAELDGTVTDTKSGAMRKQPALVITDSQAFGKVSPMVPEEVMLTSFSILMARKKGELEQLIAGAYQLDDLKDGDKVLISEGCTHHRQCNDIGTVKLPGWIREYTKKELVFEYTSGGEFPDNLSQYALVVHCGGCMLNPNEMGHRQHLATNQQIPMTNYGTAIAHMNGILNRSLKVFSS